MNCFVRSDLDELLSTNHQDPIDGELPKVTILIPAYKEEEYIETTLKEIAGAFRTADIAFEILVVVDLVPGDRTGTYVRRTSEEYPEIRIIERIGRRGVGDAITTGIREANGEIIIPVMGDQSEHPSDIIRLARKAEEVDVVFTDRFRNGKPPGYPVIKYIANRCCNIAVMVLFRIPYRDTTNAFKAYRRQLLKDLILSSRGFEIFLEIPLKVMRLGPLRTSVIEVRHTVKKKGAPKLSVPRDGTRYARLVLSLLSHIKSDGNKS